MTGTDSPSSHIDLFDFFPIEVPARTVAEMRKQGVDATLVFRLVEIELGFAVFLGDRIVALNCHNSEGSAVLRHPVPN